jgi:hypothetical protein
MKYLGYWASFLSDLIENRKCNYQCVLKNTQNRRKIYKNLISQIYKNYKPLLDEIYDRFPSIYNVIIVRGIPNNFINKEPLLSHDSIAWNYYTNNANMLGIIENITVQKIIQYLELNFDKNIPLLVCGDAYEDVYADIFQKVGFKTFTKNRSKLLKRIEYNTIALAQIDFYLSLHSQKILGPSGSSLRFVLKEARSYIYNKNFITSDDWIVIECILPIYTNDQTDILMNNLSKYHKLFGKYLLS